MASSVPVYWKSVGAGPPVIRHTPWHTPLNPLTQTMRPRKRGWRCGSMWTTSAGSPRTAVARRKRRRRRGSGARGFVSELTQRCTRLDSRRRTRLPANQPTMNPRWHDLRSRRSRVITHWPRVLRHACRRLAPAVTSAAARAGA